jgi:hypothetical protein
MDVDAFASQLGAIKEGDEMVSFQCEWLNDPVTLERSGFDLGHMTFTGEKGTCTSRGKSPDQVMMLAIAIKELLYGLEMFLKGNQPGYRFIGTDSSFSIRFQKVKKGCVAVRCGTTAIGEVEAVELCRAILSSVEAFIGQPENELPENDPVREDLFSSVQSFRRFLLAG